jgi:hypothetical protein
MSGPCPKVSHDCPFAVTLVGPTVRELPSDVRRRSDLGQYLSAEIASAIPPTESKQVQACRAPGNVVLVMNGFIGSVAICWVSPASVLLSDSFPRHKLFLVRLLSRVIAE